jgi:DNA-binding SARP family transcriptional activator/predicted ATPase
MSPTLQLQLLGEFRLLVDDQPLRTLDRPRLQALLTYLVLHRHAPQPRQQIAFCLWPDTSESQAFANLRKLVFQLRRALPQADSLLDADGQHLGWRSDAPCTVDVVELEEALSALEQTTAPAGPTVERITTLYHGELLPTCYEDWLLPRRQALHERVIHALEQALAELEAQREYALGLRTAEHLLRLDPLHEATYRHLMHLRALNGDRAGALRVYHACVTVLEQELGVPPAEATQTLYQQLLKSEPHSPAPPGAAPRHAHIPLVGRQAEWHVLQQACRQMGQHGAHFVTLWGEAGAGKTRLVEELLHWARLRPGSQTYARAYAAEGDASYAPITTWLRSEALQTPLAHLASVWQTEVARLLPELLTQSPTLPPPGPLSETWQRQRLHEALARAVLVAPSPRLLVLDDLQWCDAATLAWLRYLLRFAVQTPLLVVGTVRPEAIDEAHPLHELRRALQREAQWTELTLAHLSPAETVALAGHLTDADVTPWSRQLYRETEGNPLFVVEMMRAGFTGARQPTAAGAAAALPPTVQAVIAARLAQLSAPAQQLAQLAATLGRAFAVDVLAATSEWPDEALVSALDELWQRRIVREQAAGYDFSHDKIREVAYAAIRPMHRRRLHRRVAQALERLYHDQLDRVSSLVAAHYQQAGMPEAAFWHYRRATDTAYALGALAETEMLVERTLAILETLPNRADLTEHEEWLCVMLAKVIGTKEGYTLPRVGAAWQRAWVFAQQLTAPRLLPTILAGLRRYYYNTGNNRLALDYANRLLALAATSRDAALQLVAHHSVGIPYIELGEFAQVRAHLEQAVAYHDPQQQQQLALYIGQDPHVDNLTYLGWALWYLGYPDQALARCREAIAAAQALPHPISLTIALCRGAHVLYMRGELGEARQQLEAARERATKLEQMLWIDWANMLLGRIVADQGRLAEGIALMEIGVADYRRRAATIGFERWLALLARAYAQQQQIAPAFATLNEALALAERLDLHQWQAELLRIQGEILLAADEAAAAAACFAQALAVAREQQAKSLELRVALNLSRLWQQQGRRAEAQRLLMNIYSWFTEGHATRDLQDARRLLNELADPGGHVGSAA